MKYGSDWERKSARIEELWQKCRNEGSLIGLDFLEYAVLVKTYG